MKLFRKQLCGIAVAAICGLILTVAAAAQTITSIDYPDAGTAKDEGRLPLRHQDSRAHRRTGHRLGGLDPRLCAIGIPKQS